MPYLRRTSFYNNPNLTGKRSLGQLSAQNDMLMADRWTANRFKYRTSEA